MNVMEQYLALFLLGFFSSFGHCIGMCGGFVFAYSQKLEAQKKGSILPHLLYNFGRIITYGFLGLVLGFVGQILTGASYLQGGIQILAGIFMVLLGLEMGGFLSLKKFLKFKALDRASHYFVKTFGKLSSKNIFLLGLFLGFIPCGLVYVALAKSLTLGSPLFGLLGMLAFGLGTIPSLFILGVSSSFISSRFRQTIYKVAIIIVILFGFYTIYEGVRVVSGQKNVMKHNHHQSHQHSHHK